MIRDPAAVCSLGWMVAEVGRMPGTQWFVGILQPQWGEDGSGVRVPRRGFLG